MAVCFLRRDDVPHPRDERGTWFTCSRVPAHGERISLVAPEGGQAAYKVIDVLHVETGTKLGGETVIDAILDVIRVPPNMRPTPPLARPAGGAPAGRT
jgi:hypothetical protein